MLVLIGFAFFCLMTTFGTPDSALLGGEAEVNLPFANVPISFFGFVVAAPFLLIALIIYLHVFVGYNWQLEALRKIRIGGHEREIQQNTLDKLPALFNLDASVPRMLTEVVFYWLVPFIVASMTWKAMARPEWGVPLAGVTILVTVGLVLLHIRRSSDADRPFLRWVFIGLLCGLVVGMRLGWESFRRPFDLFRVNLEKAWLPGIDLRRANIYAGNLQGANLMIANLQGADLFNANLQGTELQEANLQEANLSIANLQGANLVKANLQGAKLITANLQGTDLTGADLREANFFLANLRDAKLINANLQGANLSSTKLKGTFLQGTDLRGADLRNPDIEGTGIRWRTSPLTEEQLEGACGNAKTKLPESLKNYKIKPCLGPPKIP